MKIRTRLLMGLLPALVGSIVLIATFLTLRLRQEMMDGFQQNLRSAALHVAKSTIINEQALQTMARELKLKTLRYVPLNETLEIDRYTQLAPVLDIEAKQIGHIAASGHIENIEKKFQNNLILVALCSCFAIILLIAILYLIAGRIAMPMQKLNNAALAIAAGKYGELANIGGSKEIADLANTLNTMSECLLENIQRLKENALFRERMYGEYECAMLLQHMMLQKNIDECTSDAFAVKSFTLFSDSPRGLLLDFPSKLENPKTLQIHIAEAEDRGFEGMYELLTQYKYAREIPKHTTLIFDRTSSILQSSGPHFPLFWSLDGKKFLEAKDRKIALESGDFFFLFNDGLHHFLKDRAIQDILAKVLKIFAQDGLETTFSMLQKELTFAAKRKELMEDIHLLCFQVLNP